MKDVHMWSKGILWLFPQPKILDACVIQTLHYEGHVFHVFYILYFVINILFKSVNGVPVSLLSYIIISHI